ncbi:MAG: hypothetical protein R2830_24525 [Saprospiraceae bacterium]
MIYQKEIREKSEQMGVLPDTVDKDWVLGHVLIFRQRYLPKTGKPMGQELEIPFTAQSFSST